MITADTESTAIQAAGPAAQEPKAATKATVATRKPRVPTSKVKSGKKTSPPKKAAKTVSPRRKQASRSQPAPAKAAKPSMCWNCSSDFVWVSGDHTSPESRGRRYFHLSKC